MRRDSLLKALDQWAFERDGFKIGLGINTVIQMYYAWEVVTGWRDMEASDKLMAAVNFMLVQPLLVLLTQHLADAMGYPPTSGIRELIRAVGRVSKPLLVVGTRRALQAAHLVYGANRLWAHCLTATVTQGSNFKLKRWPGRVQWSHKTRGRTSRLRKKPEKNQYMGGRCQYCYGFTRGQEREPYQGEDMIGSSYETNHREHKAAQREAKYAEHMLTMLDEAYIEGHIEAFFCKIEGREYVAGMDEALGRLGPPKTAEDRIKRWWGLDRSIPNNLQSCTCGFCKGRKPDPNRFCEHRYIRSVLEGTPEAVPTDPRNKFVPCKGCGKDETHRTCYKCRARLCWDCFPPWKASCNLCWAGRSVDEWMVSREATGHEYTRSRTEHDIWPWSTHVVARREERGHDRARWQERWDHLLTEEEPSSYERTDQDPGDMEVQEEETADTESMAILPLERTTARCAKCGWKRPTRA